ncbi:MAG: hypothetical protein AAFP03_02195 [Cyanobacteria bacterium J06598_3]
MPNLIPSTALLALNRFVRGPLRQMGIGIVSLMLVLGVSVQMPTEGGMAGLDGGASPALSAMESLPKAPAVRLAQRDTADAMSHELSKPSHLLSAHMTHHRLTGARFSIPASDRHQAVTSLALTK